MRTTGFNIATTFSGILLDPATVDWQVSGSGASPDAGISGGDVSIGSSTYTVTAWTDTNGNGSLDSGESSLQGTVTVVDPVLTLKDLTTGNSIQDAGGGGGILPVTKDDNNAELELSLDNALTTGPLPPRYTFEIDASDGSAIDTGSFDGDPIDIPTPPAGLYSVTVLDTEDANFERSLEFDVLQLHIVWSGSTMQGVGLATEVVPEQVLASDSSINLLAGQHMVLTYDLYQGSPIAVTGVQWNVGSLSDFVKSLTLNGPASAPTSETVVMLAAGDMTSNTVAGYEIADSPGRQINLTIIASIDGLGSLVFNTWTTINFQKPGQSIWSGSSGIPNTPNLFQVTGNYGPAKMDSGGDALTVIADWQTSTPVVPGTGAPAAGYVGTIFYVQLLVGSNYASGYAGSIGDGTGGYLKLDTQYPYVAAGSLNAGDGPQIGYTGATFLNLSWMFEDWLMWTPQGTDSIPVPVQTWDWFATATASWSGGAWVIQGTGVSSITGTNTTTYPDWNGAFEKKY